MEGNLPRGYCGSKEAFGQERLVKVSRGKKKEENVFPFTRFCRLHPSKYCQKRDGFLVVFFFNKQQFFVLTVRHYTVPIISKIFHPRLSCSGLSS